MALIYQGRAYEPPAGLTVRSWLEHGLTWRMGTNGVRQRSHGPTPRWFVHHWTGGEGDFRGVHRVLSNRLLSVHLFLGFDGVVFQYADLALACAHAGSPTNDGSIGIETQSVGHGKPHPRFARVRIPDTVHARTAATSQFSPAQVAAARLLRVMVRDVTGLPIVTLPETTVVQLRRRLQHVGDLGHYQISERKRDPGTTHMQMIAGLVK